MLHPKLLALQKNFNKSELTQIIDPLLEQRQIELWVKRDDLIHPIISGNKWRKLKYILDEILNTQYHTVISMGGAYSNHLHALAYAGKLLDINTIAYVRGEKPAVLSQTLLDIQRWGMELRFVSRADYKQLRQYKKYNSLPSIQKGQYWLPEGGASKLALKGVAEILTEIDFKINALCVPCGTGTTLAGLIKETNDFDVRGFSALRGGGFLNQEVEGLLENRALNWSINLDYHFGGFAKSNKELLTFMQDFSDKHNIILEHVYSGKMFFGLFDLIKKGFFLDGDKIVAIHTGGIQGNNQ